MKQYYLSILIIYCLLLLPNIISATTECEDACNEDHDIAECSADCITGCEEEGFEGAEADTCLADCDPYCEGELDTCLAGCADAEEVTETACGTGYTAAFASCNSAFSSAVSACSGGGTLTNDCGSDSAENECMKAEAWNTMAAGCSAATSPTTTPTTTSTTPAQETTATITTTLDNPLKAQGDNPVAIIGNIIRAMLGVVGAVTLLMFLYGGFMLIFSAGEQEKLEKGRKTLVWAVIGLAVVLSSYSILSYVFKILVGSTT